MSNPPDPTNLSQKFAALQLLMTTQHNALMAEIAALRGTGGPETTLRSINQSIWALAGAAPGATLAQLKAAIEALAGGKSLAALWSLWTPGAGTPYALLESSDTALQELKALWSPQGEGYSPYVLLNNLYQAILANGLTETDAKDILTRIIAQLDTGAVTPTVKDLLMTMSDQQAKIAANTASPFDSPVGCCEMPFQSVGNKYLEISIIGAESQTFALWPETVPDGFDIQSLSGGFTMGQTQLQSADWSQYRIYVASTASQFGMRGLAMQRHPTNQWITIADSNSGALFGWEFFVMGDNRLDVYICPVSAPGPTGGSGLQQIGWNYSGTYSNPSVGTIVNKLYTPVFTTAATAIVDGHVLKFATNADGRYIIAGRDQTLNLRLTWTGSQRSFIPNIMSRNRAIGTQGQFVALSDEPWSGSATITSTPAEGSTTPAVRAAIASIGTLDFTVDDYPVEFVEFRGFDQPAPTDLIFSLVAEV